MHFTKACGLGVLGLLAQTAVAFAQEAKAVEPPDAAATEDAPAPAVVEPTATPAPAPTAAPGPESSATGADGTRFRFGVSAGGGLLTADSINFTYGGVDLRFGAQINDLIGVYAQPQLGFYAGNAGGGVGAGGLLGGTAVVDFTPIDYFFAGVGVGYGILNNPGGAELQLRVGAYPLVSRSEEGIRRKGLMIGADVRFHFVAGYTFIAPTFSIGYEAF